MAKTQEWTTLLLSDEIKKHTIAIYAYCSNCEVIYHDDIPIRGSIMCPRCNKKTLAREVTGTDYYQIVMNLWRKEL